MTLCLATLLRSCCRVPGNIRSQRFNSFQPGLVLGFISLLSLGACSAGKPAEKALVRVAVQPVASLDVASSVMLTGDIQARKVTEQSFRVSGKLVKRYVDVGDRVRAGQVLARLDPREQKTDLASANAEVAVRESRLHLAEQNYQRQQLLLPKGYTNLSEYQKARSGLDSARGDLAALRAQQANARDQVGYTELFAVADGVITARHAEEGQVVQAATPVFNLAHDGQREAVFSAYESLLGADQTEGTVTISPLGQPSIQLSGSIREITPIVSAASGTLRVRVALPDAAIAPALGSVVSARLQTRSQRAFALPWSALSRTQGQPAVWRLDDQSKVRLTRVKVLRYEQGQVIVSEGLNEGDRVVSRGLQFLYPGQQVEVAEQASVKPAVSLATSEPAQ
ncbi:MULTISPECIES: efflux RND transporter periplasmic adaptor subunit [Pseudomonas syringae group]|uniref:Efflux transporter periplasmic adaptor subunit n=1 Tax=Pseudomonas syringae group genomosp. 3 TaxID=251701 RepID=A0ABD6V4E9_9PSED|nr:MULTISPECIES: efflux RND transporter periplasmic adaptor subunit [Pseudomonas syringae group]MBM0212353.1 efflux RND transporter periplasmic adaptor subunit [Pseudomonas syringae pv. maculicola]POD62461.1 efflux transporter periplasmic adaptor subunit [Pseudomonas syringae group genomosp. 3]PYD03337.1 efflux RND transporter periplasmic adaptor subunit [Pseudomonas syringae pv. maculicola]QQN25166.1 efflux RND transporter periplasmic adaptor subunit [Pseudomonas syringae pv. maculicola]RMM16